MSDLRSIPLAKPLLGEEEILGVRDSLESGWVTQGPKVARLEKAFAAAVGAPYCAAVSNCTSALHLALLAAGVGPGDAVLTVSHSFIATANAVRHCQAEPVFVDIDPATFDMDPQRLEQALDEDFTARDGGLWLKDPQRLAVGESPWRRTTPPLGRLAAILVVHQVGLPADMGRILPLAAGRGIPVVEDAACALGSLVRLAPDGPFEPVGKPHGLAACFSLHPRKVITTGDGGMVSTADPECDRFFRLARQHGMSASDLARHAASQPMIEEYRITGFNYRLTDIQAAVGLAQLERLEHIVARRRELARGYAERLAGLAGVTLPVEPEYARHNWQSYVTLLDAGIDRNAVMAHMAADGVSTRPGVMNAHSEPPYRQAWPAGCLPASERCRDQGLILPLFPQMDADDLDRVARALADALQAAGAGK
jgi:dTDP-4-amino-4,6-dideoxygalactose transaminase